MYVHVRHTKAITRWDDTTLIEPISSSNLSLYFSVFVILNFSSDGDGLAPWLGNSNLLGKWRVLTHNKKGGGAARHRVRGEYPSERQSAKEKTWQKIRRSGRDNFQKLIFPPRKSLVVQLKDFYVRRKVTNGGDKPEYVLAWHFLGGEPWRQPWRQKWGWGQTRRLPCCCWMSMCV